MIVLNKVPCIHYTTQFRARGTKVSKSIIDFASGIKVMIPAYIKQLGLQIWWTKDKARKIDSLSIETFKMIIFGFWVVDKLGIAQFF